MVYMGDFITQETAMTIYDEMRLQLQELLDLVKKDEQYAAAIVHGVLQADRTTAEAHRKRAIRITELKRRFCLT